MKPLAVLVLGLALLGAYGALCAHDIRTAQLPWVCIQQNERGCGWSVARMPGESDADTRARVARMVQP